MTETNLNQQNVIIGPQYQKDLRFTARMRFHQSWYRANVLNVPCGTGPGPQHTNEYGNMLNRESGRAGFNFLAPEIFQAAKDRLKEQVGIVEEYRLLHNMLSSQPMCFNLFGLLVKNHDFATNVFKKILPIEIEKITDFKFEYAPEPASEYLNDRTAFDAFAEFICSDGKRGFVGIETKLTEPFSQKHYDTPTYRRWSNQKDSPWPESSWPYLSDIRHNQLWRDHLLAVAMKNQSSSLYSYGFLMLVCHPEDKDCLMTVDNYKRLLKPDDNTFLVYHIDKFINTASLDTGNCNYQQWVADLKNRYLKLELSEYEWEASKRR